MLFLPIIFFCVAQSTATDISCGFKALPAVSSQRYCLQVTEEAKQRLEPHLEEFKFIAVGCVVVEKSKEI